MGYSYSCTVIIHRNYDEGQSYSPYEINRSGNAGTAQGATYFVYVPIPSTQIYTRPGYKFVGYGINHDSTTPSFQPGDSVTFAQNSSGSWNFHLYCIWERIAMADLASVSSPVTIGTSPGGTATWNIPDASFTYVLELSCGNAPAVTYNVAANTASKSFDIPNTWLSYLTNVTSAIATATLTTKDGATVMGTSSMQFTVKVASSVKPTLSVVASQVSTNATVNGWGKYVQGFSKVKLTATAAAGTGASISSYAFRGPNLSYTGTDAEKTSGVIDASGTVTFTVTVTDSRGRQATVTVSVSFEVYSIPIITGIDTNRCAADGTTDNAGGGFLKVAPHYSISSVDGSNSIASQALYYREHGTLNWTTLANPCADNTTYGKPTYDHPISLSKTYDIRCVVTDALGSTRDYATTLPGAGGIWYGRTNDRLGLGMVPPGPGLYIDWAMFLNEKAGSTIHFGVVDGTSTATAFTATIPGIAEYYDGLTIMLKNGVVTSAAGFTININGLGAKQSYSNMAAATADTTIFNVNYTMLFIYDSTRVAGGGWICYRGYDANTNTIGYQLRTNGYTLPASDKFYRYRLLFTSADNTKWIPANTSTSTNATASRTTNTRPINPFGPIVYYGSTTVIDANTKPGVTTLWQQYTFSLGYSFNNTGAALALTLSLPVFLRCTPQADGSAVMDYFTQTLPTTEDGKIYILLGYAYSETNIELIANHPVYYYKNGGVRLWTGA